MAKLESGETVCEVFRKIDEDTGVEEIATTSPDFAKELAATGFTQDPDVLDTWFSSWLWPFATMGWTGDKSQDTQNATLNTFYPTTDLVTGPDIIFFWVARMIMAGYEFMGDLPFRNVYFTGIIRDKQGRKMSKTLGNSPDPLNLIAKYGADALRFGTMRSAPLGQDVLFDEKDVELGRNFCNKLWNACRFRQMQGSAEFGTRNAESDDSRLAESSALRTPHSAFPVQGEIRPDLLTTDDKWILLRLNQALKEITDAFKSYNFSIATQTIYRFFWSEYCDWYVEASKAVLQGNDATRKANTLAVIDFVLSHLLRLFHPFLPFVTEELWHGMGYSVDMPDMQGGKTIMNAPWPKPFEPEILENYGLDETAEKLATAKYELVTMGRNLKAQFGIPANKKVNFILKPAGDLDQAEVETVRLLLNAETLQVDSNHQPEKGTPVVANALGELYLPLAGQVDVAAEMKRLSKELEKAEAEIAKVEAKLNNPNFTQKVPANVLEEHQQRLANWQAKRAQAQQALDALG